MIDEFDGGRLERRRAFLESRATAHLRAEVDHRWHFAAAATLLRDAAAVALILDDIGGARDLLRKSGNLFLELGYAGGLQLFYIAGTLDSEESDIQNRIDTFARAFAEHRGDREVQPAGADHRVPVFKYQSFRPPQLLRAYQGLAGRRSEDETRIGLRNAIREALRVNATMPVGLARTTLATYVATFDRLAKRDAEARDAPSVRLEMVLGSLAQQREELFVAARLDRFHWQALLRPAELIDFDLLALLLAGVRRGKASALIAKAFADRDAITALPQVLANALND
jgi:hypothetical protein